MWRQVSSHDIMVHLTRLKPYFSTLCIIIGTATVMKHKFLRQVSITVTDYVHSCSMFWNTECRSIGYVLTHAWGSNEDPWDTNLCYSPSRCNLMKACNFGWWNCRYHTDCVHPSMLDYTLDTPTLFPCSSLISVPFLSSCSRIIGILTQLAAATATRGTNRAIRGRACRCKKSAMWKVLANIKAISQAFKL